MRTLRLAELFVLKYAIATPDALEASVRADIHSLWKIPNELFNILSACAQSEPGHPKNAHEAKAIEGFKFCQQIVAMVDYLQATKTISLGEIKEVLLNIANTIKENVSLKFDDKGRPSEKGESSNVQFPHVSELIFQMIPVKGKHDRVIRDQQFGKAKTGLTRILSISISILEKLSKLEMMVPEKFTHENVTDVDINQKLPDRMSPQRAPLSVYDTVDFIRQHGDEYGIPTTEDWGTVFRDDPQLKEEMTTIINAINRGHHPRGSATVKMEIARILRDHEGRKSSNASLFEQTDNEAT